MQTKLMIGVIIILVVLGIVWFMAGDDVAEDMPQPPTTNTPDTVPVEEDLAEGDTAEVKTFVVSGENYKFVIDGEENPDIVVNEGDTVRIEFESTQGFHDLVIDEFDVATERVRDTDDMVVVEFVADSAGTYEYYCSVGNHRAEGMYGTFIVQ